MHHQCFFQLEHLVKCIPHTVLHQSISLHLKRAFSVPLNSDFHLCEHALFFHLLFQFMVLCCQDIQGNGSWHVWFLFFLFLQKSHMDHPKNIICQQTSGPAYPSVAMRTLYSPKGFPFSLQVLNSSCLLPPTPTNIQLLPISWLNQLSHSPTTKHLVPQQKTWDLLIPPQKIFLKYLSVWETGITLVIMPLFKWKLYSMVILRTVFYK